MENFAKKCKWSFLLTAIGLFAFFSCGKLDKTENLVSSQESFVRGEASVNITGTVTDPTTCLPLAGATVSSGSFEAVTDGNGHFSIPAASVGDAELVTVSKDGHIDFTFPVGYAGLTDANWLIGLPPRQDCVWVGPNEGAWYRINVSGVEYIIDVRRGSVDAWTQVCVGPGGTAFGNGIPLAFAVTGISTETPGSDVTFNNPIDIRYDLSASAASKGGVGSIGEATAAAAAAAGTSGASVVALAETVAGLIAGGASAADVATAIFGPGVAAVSPSGESVFFLPLTGALIPQLGVLQAAGFIVATGVDDNGQPIAIVGTTPAEVIDAIINGDDIFDLDHQGTGGG